VAEAFSFPSSWRWLDRPPLHLETGLRDHVVLVQYWRLGCVHSRVALHDAALLEGDLRGLPCAIVAVHVPTCDAERDEDRLRRAIAQAPGCLTHAVAAEDGSLARLPTMLLVDMAGEVRVRAVGVLRRDKVRAAVEQLCRERGKATAEARVPYVPAPVHLPAAWQPTAVFADEDRVWVASALHRRVYAFDAAGNVTLAVGSGRYGAQDGASDEASFALPASLCVHDDHLAVADAQSHTLRAIDRDSGEVSTWSGTGFLGTDDIGGGYGRDQALSSPVGMVSRDGGLYVCMAGTDQLWQVDPMTGSAMAWLGGDAIGYADQDGVRDRFAEPLGLAVDEEHLWVAEGRGQTLSNVDLAHVQRASVQDGFERPVAVVIYDGDLLVADSWQGAVFRVKADGGGCVRYLGPDDGLVEPVSLAVLDGRLWIADVGADEVFVCDLTAELPQLARFPARGRPSAGAAPASTASTALVASVAELREHSDVTLVVPTPSSADGARAVVDVVDQALPVLACDRHQEVEVQDGAVEVLLPVADAGHGCLHLRLRLADATHDYVCAVAVSATGELRATLVLPS